MRRMRPLFATICCFIAAPILIYRSFVGIPAESDLTRVEGEVAEVLLVERSNKYENTEYPAITLVGRDEVFRYLDWFPHPEALLQAIRPGDHVEMLSDVGKNGWLWQIEKDGNIIVGYGDIRKAVVGNNRFDPLLGIGLLLVGCFGVYRLINTRELTNDSTVASEGAPSDVQGIKRSAQQKEKI
jgi:hypothetical protein